MTTNTKQNTRDWLIVGIGLVSTAAVLAVTLAMVAASGVPVPPQKATFQWPANQFGEYVGGDPTGDAFTGPPAGVTDEECKAAYAQSLSMPVLKWSTKTARSEILRIPVDIDDGLAWVNWTEINELSIHFYGVEFIQNATGVPIVFADPENFTLAQLGVSARPMKAEHPDQYEWGRVDTNQMGFAGKDGEYVKWGSQYRVAIFSSMPREKATNVIMHELGHSLGLAHIHNHGQVMYGAEDGSGGLAIGLNDCQRLGLSHLSLVGAK